MAITAKNLCFSFNETEPVLKNIDFDVKEKELHIVLGANGSGKSTLFRCLAGLIEPLQGNIKSTSTISFLPQRIAPNQFMTIQQCLELGAGINNMQAVQEQLIKFNLESFAQRTVHELSGGEQQRVWVASICAEGSKYLLLDEPTASLDLHHAASILSILKELAKKRGVCLICHDWNLAISFAEKISVLHEGELLASGEPKKIINEALIEKVFSGDVSLSWQNSQPIILPKK